MPKKVMNAQALCDELYREVECALSDAWISDDAGINEDPKEYLSLVRGHLGALEESRAIIKRFLRRHAALEQTR